MGTDEEINGRIKEDFHTLLISYLHSLFRLPPSEHHITTRSSIKPKHGWGMHLLLLENGLIFLPVEVKALEI